MLYKGIFSLAIVDDGNYALVDTGLQSGDGNMERRCATSKLKETLMEYDRND